VRCSGRGSSGRRRLRRRPVGRTGVGAQVGVLHVGPAFHYLPSLTDLSLDLDLDLDLDQTIQLGTRDGRRLQRRLLLGRSTDSDDRRCNER